MNFKINKKKIFDILQIGDKSNIISRGFDYFIVVVILSNVLVMFLQTFSELHGWFSYFKAVEYVTTGIFCIEYVLRIWTAQYLYPKMSKRDAKLRFLVSFDGVVDLFTIIPAFFLTGFIAFRMLRVVRILHLFRINAQYDSFNVITAVLYEKRNQLLSSIVIILILMLASSLCMYSAEHHAQPEVFRNAFSGIWWSVSTVLTVGYGDIYPVTVLGRVMAILIAFMGVLLVAIPTGIISAGFVQNYTEKQNELIRVTDIKRPGEIKLTKGHTFIGRTIEDVEQNYDVQVLLVIRKKINLLANNQLKLEKDDILLVEDN